MRPTKKQLRKLVRRVARGNCPCSGTPHQERDCIERDVPEGARCTVCTARMLLREEHADCVVNDVKAADARSDALRKDLEIIAARVRKLETDAGQRDKRITSLAGEVGGLRKLIEPQAREIEILQPPHGPKPVKP